MRVGQGKEQPVILRLVGLWGLLLALSVTAQAEQLPIKIYTTADGLARDSINRIVRDSRGFLWFCTPEGLSRFDGYTFTNYTTNDGLPHRSVRDLLETRSGVYWVATGDGLCQFNPSRLRNADFGWRNERHEIQNPKSNIQNLFSVYHPGESETARSITTLYEDHAGTVWVGTWAGLFRLEQAGGQVKFHFVEMGMPSETGDDRIVEDILEDRRGVLWIGTRGSGLYRRWPDGRVERYTTRHGLPSNHIHALLEDRDGRLWVATISGLCQLRNADFGLRNEKPIGDTKESDHLQSAGMAIRNLQSAIRNLVARVYTMKDGLPSNWINALFQSADGKLWVGTSTLFHKFNSGKIMAIARKGRWPC